MIRIKAKLSCDQWKCRETCDDGEIELKRTIRVEAEMSIVDEILTEGWHVSHDGDVFCPKCWDKRVMFSWER